MAQRGVVETREELLTLSTLFVLTCSITSSRWRKKPSLGWKEL